jgi:hypothetical protein
MLKQKEKFQGTDRKILRRKHTLHHRTRQKVQNIMKIKTSTSRFVTKSVSKRNRNLSYKSSLGNHLGKPNVDLRQQTKTEMF